jgi:hypothetical protein
MYTKIMFASLVLVAVLTACPVDSTPKPEPTKPPANNYPVKIPDTTKVSDQSTRDALTSFDATTGTMKFDQATAVLGNLKTNDVLVSEPSKVAPYGYLRKVTSMRKEGNGMVLETAPAKLTDAIQSGSLNVDAAKPDLPVTGQAVKIKPQIGIGLDKGFVFDKSISKTLCLDDNNCPAANVKFDGRVRAAVGIKFGVGVDYRFPASFPAYLEATTGAEAFADLNLTAHFNGDFKTETFVDTYSDIFTVFIGPVPVVLHVKGDLYVGADGSAVGDFSVGMKPTLTGLAGIRWSTGNGLEKNFVPEAALNFRPPVLKIDAVAHGYIRLVTSVKMYDVFGPVVDSRVGVGLEAGFPRDPLWTVFGTLKSDLALVGTIPIIDVEIFKTAKNLVDKRFEIGKAEIQPPKITVAKPTVQVTYKKPIQLQRFYTTDDPQGRSVGVTASSNLDGSLQDKPSFTGTPGPRTVTFTASNGEKAAQAAMTVDAVNSPPEVKENTVTAQPSGLPLYLNAFAADINEPQDRLACEKLRWTASGTDVITTESGSSFGCQPRIIFSDEGQHTFSASATDPEGLPTVSTFNVNVTPRLAKNPPDVGRITVQLESDPTPIQPGAEVGQGRSLTLSVPVENPDNSPVNYEWYVAQVPDFDNSTSCDPKSPIFCQIGQFNPIRGHAFNQNQASITWGAADQISGFAFPTKWEEVCKYPINEPYTCFYEYVPQPAFVIVTLKVTTPGIDYVQPPRTFQLKVIPYSAPPR